LRNVARQNLCLCRCPTSGRRRRVRRRPFGQRSEWRTEAEVRRRGGFRLTSRWCRSYTARDLEEHYVRCGHRMSAAESKRVLAMVAAKYERNPTKGVAEKVVRLRCARKRREWETRGMYPEAGQPLMDGFVVVRKRGTQRNKGKQVMRPQGRLGDGHASSSRLKRF
jgi:hypothetical protein